ncbi:MAG: phosphatidylserine decarboxylase [Erysipelotrichaceae bacterium]|nr:phosphatidylserine decarboxylase [Erysipelotrichaceae bacterium]
MGVDYLYETAGGRFMMKCFMKTRAFKVGAWFLNSGLSKPMIRRFIKKNGIDMTPFKDQKYGSFAQFFCRQKEVEFTQYPSDTLISPCDSSLSLYSISDDLILAMKGSHYRLADLIPHKETADRFRDGLCLVFRLQATDYHRFHAFDDMDIKETRFLEGELHSVQPIALENFPVYRINRRWWHLLETENFGTAAQIEVGAMMVGGVALTKETGRLERNQEFGYFTLAGSTIILLLEKKTKNELVLLRRFEEIIDTAQEIPVRVGEALGTKVKPEKD